MKPFRSVATFASVLALCTIAALADTNGLNGSPIQISAILSTTGNGAFIGTVATNALRVIEREVNGTGGIHGRPLHFNVLDDQTNTQLDVQLTNELIAKKTALFLGPNIPAGCFASGPLIEKSGPVELCLNPFAHPQAGSYQYSPFIDSYEIAIATLRNFRERGLTRIAMINATDGTGRDADISFAAAFKLPENHGLVLGGNETNGRNGACARSLL